MRRELRHAIWFSLAAHVGLLCTGWDTQPAMSDVNRDRFSVTVELLSESQMPVPNTPYETAASTPKDKSWFQEPVKPPAPSPRLLQAIPGHGAFTKAKPQAIANQPPAYPWRARMQGWEGLVMLQVRVEPDGHPSQVWIARSSGYQVLDEAAQTAVRQWAFIPAKRGSQAVRSEVELPVRFRLMSDAGSTP